MDLPDSGIARRAPGCLLTLKYLRRLSGERRNVPDDTSHSATSRNGRRKGRRPQSAFGQLKALLSRRRLRGRLELTEDHILSVLIARRGREAVLGSNLFSEPAWDLLLELYAAKLGSRSMSLAELAKAIETPHSTTTRWIAVLDGRGLVASERDSAEPQKLWISLTDEGALKMKSLIDRWGAAFLST
jgi:DNA-binding MarR family transcriptional regulator